MLDNFCNCIGVSFAVATGSAIGAGVSFIVNCTLLEITKKKFFSIVSNIF